jgi:hypothetical protein
MFTALSANFVFINRPKRMEAELIRASINYLTAFSSKNIVERALETVVALQEKKAKHKN